MAKIDGILGDCVKVMQSLEENSLDGMITDPPYGIGFMDKDWDRFDDFINFNKQWALEAKRILKPGAYGLVFGGTNMFHKTMLGLELAGFNIHNTIMGYFASGFPKGRRLHKRIDDYFGLEQKKGKMIVAPDGKPYKTRMKIGNPRHTGVTFDEEFNEESDLYETVPTSDLAKKWKGYRTHLKPAYEPIILIQNERDGSYVENIQKWGVGGINIDGCRIPINKESEPDPRMHDSDKNYKLTNPEDGGSTGFWKGDDGARKKHIQKLYDLKGRYPTNLIIDDIISEMIDEVKRYDENNGLSRTYFTIDRFIKRVRNNKKMDGGSLGQMYYCPKAHINEKNYGLDHRKKKKWHKTSECENAYNRNKKRENPHPTVKPINLICYLARLIRPPMKNPTFIDPFMGTASIPIACKIEHISCIGIERDPEYFDIAQDRIDIPLHGWQRFLDREIPPQTKLENQLSITDMI